MKKKRKPYETTRRFPTKQKTTTKEGKRDYQKALMRVRRAELRGNVGNLPKMSIANSIGLDLKKLANAGRKKR